METSSASRRVPLLIWSDAPSASSGLARICRDIATRVAINLSDVFDVATVGYGGCGCRELPFHQYNWSFRDDWLMPELPDIWNDFASGKKGILLTIQDPGRVLWLARPETCEDLRLREWLLTKPFSLHGYFPIDATGPHNKLSVMLKECLLGYDRILTYTDWAREVVLNTIGILPARDRKLDFLPHGIDTSVFYPRSKEFCRKNFGELTIHRKLPVPLSPDELLVGIVATNQSRKDYGLGIQTFAEIAKKRKARLWIHTDALDRYWSIPALCADLGVKAIVTTENFSDETMAKLYSACDVTLGIGLGEGWGFPLYESLACGTPVIHGDYGGGAEFLPPILRIEPVAYRFEGVHACIRPVFEAEEWAERAVEIMGDEALTLLPDKLDWNNLWPKWDAWLRKGLQ